MAKLNALGDPIIEDNQDTKLNALGDPIVDSGKPEGQDVHIVPEGSKSIPASDRPMFVPDNYGWAKTGLPETAGNIYDHMEHIPDLKAPEYDGDFSPVTPEAGFNEQASKTMGTQVRLQGDITKANEARAAEIKTANQLHAENQLQKIAPGRVNLGKSLDSFGLAFDTSWSGDTNNTVIKKKILERFPGALVEPVKQAPDGANVEDTLFVKLPGTKEWVPARPYTILDTNNLADKAGATVGTLTSPPVAGSIAVGAATGGQSFTIRAAAQGAWGAISPYITHAMNFIRGHETGDEALKEAGKEAPTGAAMGVGGEALAGVAGGIKKVGTGTSGLLDTGLSKLKNPEFKEIAGAAKRLDAPMGADMVMPIMNSMVSKWRQLGIQSTVENFAKRNEAIFKNVDEGMQATKASAEQVLGEGKSYNAFDQMNEGTQAKLGLENPGKEARDAGLASQDKVKAYMGKWKDIVKASYDDLFNNIPEGTTFDLTPLQEVAQKYKSGVQMANKPVELDIGTGTPLVMPGGNRKMALDLPGGLNAKIDAIVKLDPNVAQVGDHSALEQLKQLRTSLSEYAQPKIPGRPTPAEAAAQEMYDTVSGILEKPQFPPGTDSNLVSLWQDTNSLAKSYYNATEEQNIRSVLQSEAPEDIPGLIDQGGKPRPTAVYHLKNALGEKDFQEQIGGHFRTKLFSDPDSIDKTLKAWKLADSKALDQLLSPEEQRAFVDYSREWQRLKSSQVQKMGTVFGDLDTRAKQLIRDGKPEELQALLDTAGKQAPMYREVFSYGVLSDFLQKAGAFEKGAKTVDPVQAVNAINTLEKNGLLNENILSKDVYQKLKDIREYASSYTKQNSAGASFSAAETAQTASDLPLAVIKPKKYGMALLGLKWDNTLSNMMMSDKMVEKLTGRISASGQAAMPMDPKLTRQLVRGGIQFMHELNNQAQDVDDSKVPYQGELKNLTVEDIQAMSGLYQFSPEDLRKARQNSHMRDMEKDLQNTKKPGDQSWNQDYPRGPDVSGESSSNTLRGGSAFDVLDDPYNDYASIDLDGKTSDLSEEDRLRYMEEDLKDRGPAKPAPLPKPVKKSKTMVADDDKELKEMMGKMSKTIGLKESFFEKLANAESSFGKNTQASTSSARGMMQFTEGTWKEVVKKYGQRAGVSEADIDDRKANTLMGALHTYDNFKDLKAALNRKPTEGELYMAHFLGSSGAKTLINNYKKNTNADDLFPAAAKANPTIFYKDGKPRTVKQVYHLLSAKVD